MTQVLTPSKWHHRLAARWRLLMGFCPRCNCDAPHLYSCPICHGGRHHEHPPTGTLREWWWEKWVGGS